MLQSLKTDVIYHLTPSDFEMEFNLNGACRMRLLTDKTSDKKGFVKALARDVSRSRVIIVCGPLFGKDSIITIVATAIGSGLAVCDNKTYGVNSDQQIDIIKGSTPLVTPDGFFGGCIIESGPQTIILLTENKTFRKIILQNLIHPYLNEICYMPVGNSPVPTQQDKDEEFETAVSDEEKYVIGSDEDDEPVDDSDEVSAQQDEHTIPFVMDDEPSDQDAEEDEPVYDNEFENIFMGSDDTEETPSPHYSETYTPSESDETFISSGDKEHAKRKKEGRLRAMDITIIVLVLLLLLAVLAIVYLSVLRPVSMGVSTSQYIKEIFGLVSNTTSV